MANIKEKRGQARGKSAELIDSSRLRNLGYHRNGAFRQNEIYEILVALIVLCNSIHIKFLLKPVIKIYNNIIISGCSFAKTSMPYRADSTK